MGESELQWQVESRDGARVLVPAGRVDETTAAEFGERLNEEVAAAAVGGERRVVIELGSIAYMSSRGLRALTLAQRKAKEHDIVIVLARPNPVMREILAISRYDKVFAVVERTEEGLAGQAG